MTTHKSHVTSFSEVYRHPCPIRTYPDAIKSLCLIIPTSCLIPTATKLSDMLTLNDASVTANAYSYVIETFLAIIHRIYQRDLVNPNPQHPIKLFMTKIFAKSDIINGQSPEEQILNISATNINPTHIRLEALFSVLGESPNDILESFIDDVKMLKTNSKFVFPETHGRVWAVKVKELKNVKTKHIHNITLGDFNTQIKILNNLDQNSNINVHLQPLMCFSPTTQLYLLSKSHSSLSSSSSSQNEISLDKEYNNVKLPHFPFDGKNTFQISINQWRPDNWGNIIFPWIVKSLDDKGIETRAKFLNTSGCNYMPTYNDVSNLLADNNNYVDQEILSELSEIINAQAKSEDLEQNYDRLINIGNDNAIKLTEDIWKEETRRRFEAAEKLILEVIELDPKDLEEIAKVTIQFKREALIVSILEFFRTVWQKNASICPARLAAIEWFHQHLIKKQNFSFSRKHNHGNLSSFADLMVSNSTAFESLHSLVHMHKDLILARFAILHGGQGSDFHTNPLVTGHAAAGKSFAQKCLIKGMIPGTYHQITKITPAAFTGLTGDPKTDPVATHAMDMQTIFFDDIPPSFLGIDGTNRTKAQAEGGNDNDSNIKSIMTSGQYDLFTMVMSNEDHNLRQRVSINYKTRCVWVGSGNVRRMQIPAPLESRWFCYGVDHDDRKDEKTASDKSDETLSFELKSKLNDFNERFKRNQCFSMIIGLLIEGLKEFMPEIGIDMSTTRQMMHYFKEESKKDGQTKINIEPRKKEQIEFLQIGAVIEDALDRFFDLEISPFHQRNWDPLSIIYLFDHLVSTQEHYSFTFGLVADELENKSKSVVDKALYDYIHTHTKPLNIGQKPPLNIPYPQVQSLNHVAQAGQDEAEQITPSQFSHIMNPKPGSNNLFYEAYIFKNPFTQSKNQKSFNLDYIGQLATWIRPYSMYLVDLTNIQSLLTELMNPTILTTCYINGDLTSNNPRKELIPRLIINDNEIIVAKDTIYEKLILEEKTQWKNQKTSNIKELVKKSMSHFYVEPRTILYGSTILGKPDEFDSFKILKNDIRRVITNYNWRSREVMAKLNCDYDMQDNQQEDLDIDIDRYFITKRRDLALQSGTEMNMMPSPIPIELCRQLLMSQYPIIPKIYPTINHIPINPSQQQQQQQQRGRKRTSAEIRKDSISQLVASKRICVNRNDDMQDNNNNNVNSFNQYRNVMKDRTLIVPNARETYHHNFNALNDKYYLLMFGPKHEDCDDNFKIMFDRMFG
jgi:hypothetical protein